jgi:hypothetical protein
MPSVHAAAASNHVVLAQPTLAAWRKTIQQEDNTRYSNHAQNNQRTHYPAFGFSTKSYAKMMQTRGKRACSQFPECSLSYAKIGNINESLPSFCTFYIKKRGIRP